MSIATAALKVLGSTLTLQDSTTIARDVFDMTHGRATFGGGGTDFKVVCGPMPAFETSNSGCWSVATGTTPSSANVLTYGDASNGYINAAGASGAVGFTEQGSFMGKLGPYSGTVYGIWLGQGAGFAANNLALGSDASSVTFLNAPLAASDLQLRFGGTTAMQFDAGTQNGVALGANIATTGHMRVPAGFQWLVRNSGNTANNTILGDDGANNISMTSGYASATLSAASINIIPATQVAIETTTWYQDATTFHIRDASHNEVATMTPGTASTPNALAIGAAAGGVAITGAQSGTVRTVTAATLTIDTTTTDRIIFVDCTTNGITLTLPTPTAGRMLTIIDKANNCGNAAGGKQLTLARHATELLDGAAANHTTSSSGFHFNVYSDGTNWYTQNGIAWNMLPLSLFLLRRRRRTANDLADVADAFQRAA